MIRFELAALAMAGFLALALPAAADPLPFQAPDETATSASEFLDLGEELTTGVPSAQVVLVEFSDFQCPYCGDFSRETFPQIAEHYILTGKVRYAVRQFPLPMHPQARQAAKAAKCADEQGKFWPMHDLLFEHQRALEDSEIGGYAKELGLDMTRFNQCRQGEGAEQSVEKHLKQARGLGISGTPTILICRSAGNGRVRVVDGVEGALPFESYQQAIDKVLQQTQPQDTQP